MVSCVGRGVGMSALHAEDGGVVEFHCSAIAVRTGNDLRSGLRESHRAPACGDLQRQCLGTAKSTPLLAGSTAHLGAVRAGTEVGGGLVTAVFPCQLPWFTWRAG